MIYAISDIHGRKEALQDILEQINFSCDDELYILGDIIDRGPNGVELLQWVMTQPNVHMLLGNHELMMLDSLSALDPDVFANWITENNGGMVTFSKFKKLPQDERLNILSFIRKLPVEFNLEVNGRRFQLLHAASPELFRALRPENKMPGETEREFCVWDRGHYAELADIAKAAGKTIILGHTPVMNIFKDFDEEFPAQILEFESGALMNIDCGAAYLRDPWYGDICRLACIRLEDMEEFYSSKK